MPLRIGGLARLRRRPRDQRGAAAVEFALIFPILVMLLLGIATTGLSYSRAMGLTNAVREGVRFGATTDHTNASAWSSQTIQRVRDTQFDDQTTQAASSTTVCVQLFKKTGVTGGVASGAPVVDWVCQTGGNSGPVVVPPTGPGVAPAVPPETPNNSCVVRVVASRNYTINIVLASWSKVNAARAVARYERTDVSTTCT